jgi:chlorobactene glucosyltransferase
MLTGDFVPTSADLEISLSNILFWLYCAVGPALWLGVWIGVVLARSRMNRLDREFELPQPPPSVAVIIPAKDEGAGIRACLKSVMQQDYAAFTIVATNDRSDDDTGVVMDEVASASDGKVRVIHIARGTLPDGWLGKCHALHVATRTVSSDPWLLFVDSDVELKPGAIRRAVAVAEARGYDALSILTDLRTESAIERIVLPLAAATWATMYTVSMTNRDESPEHAYANGQFFLIRRDAYEQVGGHETVRSEIVEDCALMSALKLAGFKVRLLLGQELARTRMHTSWAQMKSGWARIYAGTSKHRTPRIYGAMVVLMLTPVSYTWVPCNWRVAETCDGSSLRESTSFL